MKKLIIFLFSVSLFAQDYGNDAEALELCTTLQSNSFSSDLDADNALDRILSVVGLSKNFVLSPCNDINNAVAVSYKGVRYILYDPEFMSMLSSNTSNWTNLFILAHEVGHHVNGHSLDLVLYAGDIVDAPELEKKRQQELEADEFAGFVLAKLGASLTQTTSSVSKLSNLDDTYSTHPKRDKRVASISKGWDKGFVKKAKDKIFKNNNYKNNISFTPIINSDWSYLQYDKDRIIDDWVNRVEMLERNIDPFLLNEKKEKTPNLYRVIRAKGYSLTDNSEVELIITVSIFVKYMDLKAVGKTEVFRSTNWKVFLDGFDETPKVGDDIFVLRKLDSEGFEILEKDRINNAGTGYGKVNFMIDENYSRIAEVKLYGYGFERFFKVYPMTYNIKGKDYVTMNYEETASLSLQFGDDMKTRVDSMNANLGDTAFLFKQTNEQHIIKVSTNSKDENLVLKTAEIGFWTNENPSNISNKFIDKLKKGTKMYLKFKPTIEWKYEDNGQKKSKDYFIETKTYVFDLKGSSKALSF